MMHSIGAYNGIANNNTALSFQRHGGLCSQLLCSLREMIVVSSFANLLHGPKLIQDRRCNHTTHFLGRRHYSTNTIIVSWLRRRFDGHLAAPSQEASLFLYFEEYPASSPTTSRNP
jgi:hypothetical protein